MDPSQICFHCTTKGTPETPSFDLSVFFFLKFSWFTIFTVFAVQQSDPVIYINTFPYIIFHHGLSQETGYSSLCYTVGHHCLSILFFFFFFFFFFVSHPHHMGWPRRARDWISFPVLYSRTSLFIYSFFFFFFFSFLGPHPQHMESPRLARNWIGATAAGLHHSHSNTGSEPCLQPTLQLSATLDP